MRRRTARGTPPPRASRSIVAALCALLAFGGVGCAFLRGPEPPAASLDDPGLGSLVETTFRRGLPETDPSSISSLRAAADFWRKSDETGRRRYEGALVPSDEDLYDDLVRRIDGGARAVVLSSREFWRIGWDAFTVVSYAVDGTVIGTDRTALGPVTPPARRRATMGWGSMAWWEILELPFDAAVYAAIGAKEAAFEIAKAPLSALEMLVLPSVVPCKSPFPRPEPLRAVRAGFGDLADAATALAWRFRVRAPHGPLTLVRELAEAVPIVGPWLWIPDRPTANGQPAHAFLGQGIHLGDTSAQAAAGWLHRTRELRADRDAAVAVIPNVEGTAVDVAFSLFGLSHGNAYRAASEIVLDHGVDPGDPVDLLGFSGSVQRFLVASRLLARVGVPVETLTGVAGPFRGRPSAQRAVVYLGGPGSPDMVVRMARIADTLIPVLPRRADVVDVASAGEHHVPYFPNGRCRAPESGYRRPLEGGAAMPDDPAPNAAPNVVRCDEPTGTRVP